MNSSLKWLRVLLVCLLLISFPCAALSEDESFADDCVEDTSSNSQEAFSDRDGGNNSDAHSTGGENRETREGAQADTVIIRQASEIEGNFPVTGNAADTHADQHKTPRESDAGDTSSTVTAIQEINEAYESAEADSVIVLQVSEIQEDSRDTGTVADIDADDREFLQESDVTDTSSSVAGIPAPVDDDRQTEQAEVSDAVEPENPDGIAEGEDEGLSETVEVQNVQPDESEPPVAQTAPEIQSSEALSAEDQTVEVLEPLIVENTPVAKLLGAPAPVGPVSKETADLLNYLSMDPKLYNNDLAVIAATLSAKAYDEEGVKNYINTELGFPTTSISTYNYSGSFAFSLAKMEDPVEEDEDDSDILLIDVRGSSTIKEFLEDALTPGWWDYLGYKVYGVVDTFYKEIDKRLNEYMNPDDHYKILVTGHSLGGATANLTAAMLTSTGKNDVYCYTFGAIDSITSDTPVTQGYENIHNVYNDFDTFSPSQFASIMINGAGRKYGKFGHIDDYAVDHRTEDQKDDLAIVQIYSAVNHNSNRYLEDVTGGAVTCKTDEPAEEITPHETDDESSDGAGKSKTDKTSEEIKSEDAMADKRQAIHADIVDSRESFNDYLQTYARLSGGYIIYSDIRDDLNCDWVRLLSTNLLKESDGTYLLLLDVYNTGNRSVDMKAQATNSDADNHSIRIGISNIVINGVPIDRQLFISEPFVNQQHMILTLSIEQLFAEASLSPTWLDADNQISFTLHIYDDTGAELNRAEVVL